MAGGGATGAGESCIAAEREGRLGQPTLTTGDAVGQALAVGPIQGAGFVLFLIAATAGAATPLVLMLALAGALSLAWTISLYARRHAGIGCARKPETFLRAGSSALDPTDVRVSP